jgi:hypothetical protein
MKLEILTARHCTKIKGHADLPVATDVSEGLKASLLSLDKREILGVRRAVFAEVLVICNYEKHILAQVGRVAQSV